MARFGSGWWLDGRFSPALTAPSTGGGGGTLTQQVIAYLIANGGYAWDGTPTAEVYTSTARTVRATSGSAVGSITEITGSGKNAEQTGSAMPTMDATGIVFASGDFLVTPSIDFSGTDTMALGVNYTKSSDANGTSIMEAGGLNGGGAAGVSLRGPPYSTGAGFGFVSKGSGSTAEFNDAPSWPAPTTKVLLGVGRISSDTCRLDVDGTTSGFTVADQGSGNYQNAPLYIGAGNNGTNLYFGGKGKRWWVTPFEPDEEGKLLLNRWCAEPDGITIANKWILACIGNSYTEATAGGVTLPQRWVTLLNDRFSRITHAFNAGKSGNTSCDMIADRSDLLRYGIPNAATIEIGQNDGAVRTVQASPAPTTTTITVDASSGYKKDGWLLVGGVQAQLLSVVGNNLTFTAPLAGGAPSAGTQVLFDTRKNIAETALFIKNAGCKRVMVLGLHYCNTATGGDTVAAQEPVNAAIRAKQQAAAADAGVEYVDLYEPGRQRIIAGLNTQGDALWHIGSSDRHLSAAGNAQLYADPIEAFMIAKGWN